jgi:hypothetical protein
MTEGGNMTYSDRSEATDAEFAQVLERFGEPVPDFGPQCPVFAPAGFYRCLNRQGHAGQHRDSLRRVWYIPV